MKSLLLCGIVALLLTTSAVGQVNLLVDVTSSTPTTVDITFSVLSPNNTFGASSNPNQLPTYIFIDYTGRTVLTTAFSSGATSQDITSFSTNTLIGDLNQAIIRFEVRTDPSSFDRLGFQFDGSLTQSTSLVDGTSLSLTLASNNLTLTTEDFDGLNVYWGTSGITGFSGGILIGTTTAVPEPADFALYLALFLVPFIGAKRFLKRK